MSSDVDGVLDNDLVASAMKDFNRSYIQEQQHPIAERFAQRVVGENSDMYTDVDTNTVTSSTATSTVQNHLTCLKAIYRSVRREGLRTTVSKCRIAGQEHLNHMLSLYKDELEKSPLKTKAMTSLAIAIIGDIIGTHRRNMHMLQISHEMSIRNNRLAESTKELLNNEYRQMSGGATICNSIHLLKQNISIKRVVTFGAFGFMVMGPSNTNLLARIPRKNILFCKQ